jgi:AcrR family transcriptional regulator
VSKGQQTREMILEKAAILFSRQGYFGSSISDLMEETGLKKGGIFNHFESKEQLALEAFDYSVDLIWQRIKQEFENKPNRADRLLAVVSVFRWLAETPPLPGGCPILNTAIEADDAHPALRERARLAMDAWRDLICRNVRKGIERGEIRSEVEPEFLATILISTLEGAVMMSKLYRDPVHMHRAVDHLTTYIENSVRIDN